MSRDNVKSVRIDWSVLVRDKKMGGAGGYTTEEIAELIGMSQNWVQKQLRPLLREGRIRLVGRRRATRIDGIPCWLPEYELTEGT